MSEKLTAADLNRRHLGLRVQVSQDHADVTDVLIGVNHDSDGYADLAVSQGEQPAYMLGRISTTLTFAIAGSIQVHSSADVQTLDRQAVE